MRKFAIVLTSLVSVGFVASAHAQQSVIETSLAAWALSDGKNANLFTLSARGDFGWANPQDLGLLSFSASAPLALVLKSGSMTWAPFVTPGFGWGRMSPTGAASISGSRFMMGGGLGMTHA